MKKLVGLPLLLVLSLVFTLALATACGSAAESPTEAPAPTAAPQPTAAPTAMPEPTATPAEQMEEKSMSADEELVAYAASVAGGPGAIYVGDLNQLAGPAPEVSLGGIDEEGKPDGSVPLDSLERHLWIYESDYYQDLLDKAKSA